MASGSRPWPPPRPPSASSSLADDGAAATASLVSHRRTFSVTGSGEGRKDGNKSADKENDFAPSLGSLDNFFFRLRRNKPCAFDCVYRLWLLRTYNLSFLGSSRFLVGQVNFCRDPPDQPPSAGGVKRVCKHRKRLITKGFIAAEWPRRAVPHVCVGGVAAFRGWMAVVYFVLRSPKRQLGGLAERLRRVSSINSASSRVRRPSLCCFPTNNLSGIRA